MIETAITKMLGIQYPVFQGGMAWIADGKLAAAVSNGGGLGIIAACVGAAKSRLRPVLMTTCTTILGMVPMAVSQGVGAEMWRPLGIAVIGGLTISTIMTMIYVPAMYTIFAAIGVKRKRVNIRKQRELNEYWKEHKHEEQLKHKEK